MPKIPLYQAQSQIGTYKGVDINPQYAINLAKAQSQNETINVFKDVLGLGEAFVKQYKDTKYKSDMDKAKKLDEDFTHEADIAWIEAQAKGMTAKDFKEQTLPKLKQEHLKNYEDAGFFGESYVDAIENFNLTYDESSKAVDLKIAQKGLEDNIQGAKDALFAAQERNDPKAEQEAIDNLALLVGPDQARIFAAQGRQQTVLQKTLFEETKKDINNTFSDMVKARTDAVAFAETMMDKKLAVDEHTEKIKAHFEQLKIMQPSVFTDLKMVQFVEDLLEQDVRTVQEEFYSATGVLTLEAKQHQVDSLVSELHQINQTIGLEKREEQQNRVNEITERLVDLGYYNQQSGLDAQTQYKQAGAYTTAQAKLTTITKRSEMDTYWAELETQKANGKFTQGQWSSLELQKQGFENQEHARVFVNPLTDIVKNRQNWTEDRINQLEGITEEQRKQMIAVYNAGAIEDLYTAGKDAVGAYSKVTQQTEELRRAVLGSHYYLEYGKASTEEQRKSILEQAASDGVSISLSDYGDFKNMTAMVEDIASKLFATKEVNGKEQLIIPKNLALDLYDELISIAGGEEAYSAQNSVVSKFERQLYAQFEQVILPTIGTMNNEAQINAIGMIRSIIKQRVEEIEEGKPQGIYEPYNLMEAMRGELVPITTIEQARATGNKAVIRRMEEYLQATEEYKNSVQGVNDFLMISLYPMLDQAALEVIMHGVRQQTTSQSATEVYGQ